jgi:hypothetical protein
VRLIYLEHLQRCSPLPAVSRAPAAVAAARQRRRPATFAWACRQTAGWWRRHDIDRARAELSRLDREIRAAERAYNTALMDGDTKAAYFLSAELAWLEDQREKLAAANASAETTHRAIRNANRGVRFVPRHAPLCGVVRACARPRERRARRSRSRARPGDSSESTGDPDPPGVGRAPWPARARGPLPATTGGMA